MDKRLAVEQINRAESVLFLTQQIHVLHVKLNNLPGGGCRKVMGLSRAFMGFTGGFCVFFMPFHVRTEKQVLPLYEPSPGWKHWGRLPQTWCVKE
ncbi:hypothetical protein FACS1894130_00530 [Spirochaetia bacterium]|nr:hypothetical protein FACS1894130_00530 [Spirochaetia bacterium]